MSCHFICRLEIILLVNSINYIEKIEKQVEMCWDFTTQTVHNVKNNTSTLLFQQ